MGDKFDEFVGAEGGADMVNSPSHYTDSAIECIDAISASMTRDEILGYLKGSVQKYVWRYEKKARWYLDRLIAELEQVDD